MGKKRGSVHSNELSSILRQLDWFNQRASGSDALSQKMGWRAIEESIQP